MRNDGLINNRRLLDTFIELIKINSPSFGEADIAAQIVKKLERCGCSVTVQGYDRGVNIIGRKKGVRQELQTLVLSAHMDTIEPTLGIRFSVDNEVVRSEGETVLGADDKSAIAQIIEALAVLVENRLPHGDIEVVFTSAEEKGLCGAKNLDISLLEGRHAIVLDSSGSVGNIIFAAPTHITYEMRITGKAAHAGIEPEKGISAIRAAARIISAVPDGRIDGQTTANMGVISGGTATNVVPLEAVINGEIRGHDDQSILKVKEEIFGQAGRIADEFGAAIRITDQEEYRRFRLAEDDPFLVFVASSMRRCGIEPLLTETGGGSDANIFNDNGIRAVNISNGMKKIHSKEEFISLKDLHDGCRVLLECITGIGDFRPSGPY